MAIDLLSESSSPVGMSPRISFSHDLSQSDINEQRQLRSMSSSSNADFDFCIHQIFNQESTSAEELFSNGKILPIQVQEKLFSTTNSRKDHTPPSSLSLSSSPLPSTPPNDRSGKVDDTKNNINNEASSNEPTKCATGSESTQKQKSKSFWQFKRSSSLNCGNGYARSLCPLPPLLRSNSTGSSSSSSSKRSSSSLKESLNHKQNLVNLQKTNSGVTQTSIKHSQFSSSSNSYQRPPLKKSNGYGTSHGNGTVRIYPVLNVPSANLFGLGSIFTSNKETKNKKK